MSEQQRTEWEERIINASSPEEEQRLMNEYLRELGVIPQVFI